jgi:CP family cyanate transporter-like MFS transporter
VARRVGVHRTTLLSLLLVVLGLGGRALVDSSASFLMLSLVALAGMAAANVLLPSLVRLHFPDRIGLVTAVYTTALAVGLTSALALTVPIADATTGWRGGLGAWAALGAIAVLPWLTLVAHDRALDPDPHEVRLGQVARTPLGWGMAVFFGLQSLQAYVVFGWFAQLWRDAGFSPTAAGLLVGLVAAMSIPLSFWLPQLLARAEHQARVLMPVIGCYLLGYAALLVEPRTLAVPAAILVGTGCCTFPMALTLIGLRTRTPAGTAALSGFTQSVGYLIAGIGPFAVGALYDASDGWTWPLLLLAVLVLPMLWLAAWLARERYVEDALRQG